VFGPSTYVSADFAARSAQVYRLVQSADGKPEIAVRSVSAPDVEPLRRQLESFVESARTGRRPVVSGADGRRALALAHVVLSRMATGD
jgi:predicted dehydrogenase